MNLNFELVIVLPCYNEAHRLQLKNYSYFLEKNPEILLCFVNDGSYDTTFSLLKQLKNKYPSQIHLMNLKKNRGKAEAVRKGILKCLQKFQFKKIAYLDADLSTTLEECVVISKQIKKPVSFVFGSRIAKLDTTIQRKPYRFYIGRCIATLIAKQLQLEVYDTQCGCKVFERFLAEVLFQKVFISRWLFDVELFHRLIAIYGKNNLKDVVSEIPLKLWSDTEDSTVPISYFFKLWIDLRNIKLAYKTTINYQKVSNETILE